MHLVLAGDFKRFDFLKQYEFEYYKTKLDNADIMEVILHGHEPVLFATIGYTKVQITMNLMKILDAYPIDSIILMGNCGLIAKDRGDIGDIAISTQVFQHDLHFRAVGYQRGDFPVNDGVSSLMPADRALTHLAKKASKIVGIPCTTGIYASGDQFVAGDRKAHYLLKQFDACFADSEAGAVSEVANTHGYPFVVIKGISNEVSPCGGEEFKKYKNYASCQSGMVVLSMLEYMQQN